MSAIKKPNELARQILSRAADHHSRLADQYEQLADTARRYAIAMREADVETIISAADELDGISIADTKRAALRELDLLRVADPEFVDQVTKAADRYRIMKMSREELLLELLIHSARCQDSNCDLHTFMERRAREL